MASFNWGPDLTLVKYADITLGQKWQFNLSQTNPIMVEHNTKKWLLWFFPQLYYKLIWLLGNFLKNMTK